MARVGVLISAVTCGMFTAEIMNCFGKAALVTAATWSGRRWWNSLVWLCRLALYVVARE